MLLLPSVDDFVPLVILVAEGVITWRGLLLLVGAYIPQVIDQMRVVDRPWRLIVLGRDAVCTRSNPERDFVVGASVLACVFLVLRGSYGLAPDASIVLKEATLLPH